MLDELLDSRSRKGKMHLDIFKKKSWDQEKINKPVPFLCVKISVCVCVCALVRACMCVMKDASFLLHMDFSLSVCRGRESGNHKSRVARENVWCMRAAGLGLCVCVEGEGAGQLAQILEKKTSWRTGRKTRKPKPTKKQKN